MGVGPEDPIRVSAGNPGFLQPATCANVDR
jgi:hypothetical protein